MNAVYPYLRPLLYVSKDITKLYQPFLQLILQVTSKIIDIYMGSCKMISKHSSFSIYQEAGDHELLMLINSSISATIILRQFVETAMRYCQKSPSKQSKLSSSQSRKKQVTCRTLIYLENKLITRKGGKLFIKEKDNNYIF